MDFEEFLENLDFRQKIKVAKSIRNVFKAILGMTLCTRRETTPRYPGDVILPSHASVGVGQAHTLPYISFKLAKNR